MGTANATSNNMNWAGPRPLLAIPNVTAHPSTASVPIIVLLYNGLLLYGFNVPVKGLTYSHETSRVDGSWHVIKFAR